MMTGEQMTTLKGLSGTEFDRTWLQMMIDHHTSAINMANTRTARRHQSRHQEAR
jgi:uncharacterized protein (DUF305 family)